MLKPKSYKQVNILLALLSILISGALFTILYFYITPYELQPVRETAIAGDIYYNLVHDFDHDGFSETIELHLNKPANRSSHLIYEHSGRAIAQFNYDGIAGPDWLNYFDYNGDGYDEIFTITRQGDSLFLYVVDVLNKTKLIDHKYILHAPKHYKYKYWDVGVVPLSFKDFDKDGKKELLFKVSAGYAILPRALYIYDFEEQRITRRFEASAPLVNMPFFYDLTGDGEDEIITGSVALGNVHDGRPFNDQTCWLFVFNHKLELKFKPLNFGVYPNNIDVVPFNYKGAPHLLAANTLPNKKDDGQKLFVINARGKIVKETTLPVFDEMHISIDPNDRIAPIYLSFNNYGIIRLNNDLTIHSQKKMPLPKMELSLKDIDLDGKSELIVQGNYSFIILDTDFHLLAQVKTKKQVNYWLAKKNGRNEQDQLWLFTGARDILYNYKGNHLYGYALPAFLVLSLLLYLALRLHHKWSALLFIYFASVGSYLKNSDHGILLIDYNGTIINFNTALGALLNLHNIIQKKQAYQEAFAASPFLNDFINRAIQKNVSIEKQLLYEGKEIILKATPLAITGSFSYGWFIEVQNITDPIHNERLMGWSKTAQKLAHDIKTPLSSIALNISNLQSRLDRHKLPDENEINDDLDIMREEVGRVRDMTKSFLKFVNLEKPVKEPVNLRRFVSEIIDSFQSFITEDVDLLFDIPDNLTDVWLDPRQMKMVFQILIENAIDAIKGDGQIQFSAILAQNLYPITQTIEIEICDNGPGIPEKEQSEIFDPYFTTKRDGTGMGLAIAKKIIADHNGTISLYSKNGFGATFNISLPIK